MIGRHIARAVAVILGLAAAAMAGAANAQPLVVAIEPQAAAAPLIIAAERGWFVEEGLDVHLVHFHANRTMVMGLAEGDVDLALVGLSAEAFAMAADHQLRIVAGAEQLDAAHPRYAWLLRASLAAGGLEAIGARPGVTVGLTEPDAVARFLLDRRLSGGASALSYAAQGSTVALAAALSRGAVDAALLPAHLAADLEATGAAVVAGWSGDVEGPVSLSVLMTTAAQSRLRPDVLTRFLRAYVRGVRAYHQMVLDVPADAEGLAAAERSAMLAVIAAEVRRPAAEIATALPYIPADALLDPDSLSEQLAWWKEQGACSRDIDLATLIDLASLAAAIAGLEAEEAAQQPVAVADPGDGAQTPATTDPSAAGGP